MIFLRQVTVCGVKLRKSSTALSVKNLRTEPITILYSLSESLLTIEFKSAKVRKQVKSVAFPGVTPDYPAYQTGGKSAISVCVVGHYGAYLYVLPGSPFVYKIHYVR